MIGVYCTLGPACANEACLEAMIMQGLVGVRLNLSHTSLQQEEELIAIVHRAFKACDVPLELVIDMQGPELRIDALEEPLALPEGTYVMLDSLGLPVQVRQALEPGHTILLDDGKLLLTVEDTHHAFVRQGGTLFSRKSVTVPGLDIELPALTEADLQNIRVAKDYGVTGVMQPFVRTRADLEAVRAALDAAGGQDIKLYAKLENLAGVEHLPELLPAADVFVVARGDLGNAVPLWELPAVQKRIAALCTEAGKPFMVATQLLSSMEKNPVPTRAEVSDVFNAVLDGASSLIATGETAIGEHPIKVISYLSRTVQAAEAYRSIC